MYYIEGFEDWHDVLCNFSQGWGTEHTLPEYENVIPVFAIYEHESYEGSAVVAFVQNEELKIVYGSHCSCMGLEGQWDPETVPWKIAGDFIRKTWWYNGTDRERLAHLVELLANSPDRAQDIEEMTLIWRLSS